MKTLYIEHKQIKTLDVKLEVKEKEDLRGSEIFHPAEKFLKVPELNTVRKYLKAARYARTPHLQKYICRKDCEETHAE